MKRLLPTVRRTIDPASMKKHNMAADKQPPLHGNLLHAAIITAFALVGATPAMAQTDPFNPLPRDPNGPANARGNSNLGTPGLTDSVLSFGVSAQVKRIDLQSDKAAVPADGRSVVKVTVKLLDLEEKPISADLPVLLETTKGRIVAPSQGNTALESAIDRDKTAPGVQATARQGEFSFELVAPGEPGDVYVRVSSGQRQQTLKLTFVPDLREMIAVGLIEGVIALNKQNGGLLPARPSDGFEQEIRRFQREFSQGDGSYGLRTAFFLKGKISGATLLTAAYDSDKDLSGRMFRDIRADEFYPVYGDASLKGYDAQTSGRFYVRADNGKNYVLYGDLNTSDQVNEALRLGRYNRSLTGAKGHWETETINLTAYASKDSLRQVVDELPGKGISGPYTAKYPNGVQGSEKVELIVRDRNAPAVILRTTPMVRLIDYDFEPFSGRILFRSPVPSLDENLNPISIRISYEVEEGGPKYWVAGFDGSVKLGSNFTLGAAYNKDENPLAKYELADVNAQLKLGDKTRMIAEFARSKNSDVVNFGSNIATVNNPNTFDALTTPSATGNAYRLELQHQSDKLEARAYTQKTDAGFSNISNATVVGRQESGGKATYALTNRVRIVGEALQSKDLTSAGTRQSTSLSAQWDITPTVTAEAGIRHAEQKGAGATILPTSTGGGSNSTGGYILDLTGNTSSHLNDPYSSTSARLKGTWRPTSASSLFVEAEQDTSNHDAHGYAIGGDYRFSEVGRVYGRSESSTGLSGAYGTAGAPGTKTASTVIGVDAQYMKDGQVFSEYRLRDGLASRDAVAAMGVRNYWPIAEGLRLNTTLERVKVLDGTTDPAAKAAGVGLDYTASKTWKGSTRLEWREDNRSTSWLSTLAVARKLSDDWTLLARNYSFRQSGQGIDTGSKNNQDRFQVGFAWRQTEINEWNVLGKYEYRREFERTRAAPDDDKRADVNILSLDATYHPGRSVWYGAKAAAKQRSDILSGTPDKFSAQLLQGRIIYDITNRWDVGLIVSHLRESSNQGGTKTGVGVEAGRVLTDNLWLSLGYNFRELKDRDLATDYSTKGVYLKLRYKFNENLFKRGDAGADKTVVPTAAPAK